MSKTNQYSPEIKERAVRLVQRADAIALEDLHAKGMLRNHPLAGAIADVGIGEFRRQIECKAAWAGRKVIVVDRWAPTSKTCSHCGSYCNKYVRFARKCFKPHGGFTPQSPQAFAPLGCQGQTDF